MLVFRTVIPLNPVNDIQKLVDISIKWISGSSHYKLNGTLLAHMGQRDFIEQIENEKFECFSYAEDNTEFACIFFENYECDKKWRSEVVFKKSESKTLFSINIFCETRDFVNIRDSVNKPYIIKLLGNEVGFSDDGQFNTGNEAHTFNNNEIQIAENIINGEFSSYLPCLYVSKNKDGEYDANTEVLSKLLSGIAHVFLEPHIYFSYELKKLTYGKNPYMGAIGIFFPDNGARKYVIPSAEYKYTIRSRFIFNKIKNVMIFGAVPEDLSYSTIRLLSIHNMLKKQKKDSDEFFEYADKINKELTGEVKRLKEEIFQLKRQDGGQEIAGNEKGYIICNTHHESYPGQITDLIIEILNSQKENFKPGTRARAIIDALLQENTKLGEKEEIIKGLKSIFRGYRSMAGTIESRLNEFNFVVERNKGNHYKLYFEDYSQIFCTVPTSVSDSRSGNNLVSDIKRHLL